MVYPVSGYTQQALPAANTFTPGGSSETVKRPDEDKRLDPTRPSGTETARSESTSNRNATYQAAANDRSQDSGGVSTSASRGQNLDITA